MTDEEPGVRRRIRCVDFTEAFRRPHVVSRYGPHPKDKLPARLRPTNQQITVAAVTAGALLFGWWILRGVLDAILPGQLWIGGAVAVAVVLAKVWHRKPFDERILARSARSIVAARWAAGGKTVGPHLVHGVATRNPRTPNRRRIVDIPASEEIP